MLRQSISSVEVFMKRSLSIILLIFLISFSLFLGVFLLVYQNGVKEVKAGTGDNVSGWAWSENIGWLSFNCYNDYDGDGSYDNHCGGRSSTGLVLDMRFEEGPGNYTTYDETGNNNDGYLGQASDHSTTIPDNVPTWKDSSECKFGKCLEFDGNDYVRVYDSSNLDITGDMTIEAWVKFYNVDGPEQSIVAKCEDYASFALRINQLKIEEGTTRKVGMKLEDGEHNQFLIESTTLVENNRWYHLVAVKDGTSLKLYLNAELEPDTLEGVSVAPNTYDLFIGGDPKAPSPGELNYPFYGLIDEVKIYNRALTESEINTHGYADYGVNIGSDGIFSGYAWSENIGWIAFADYNGDGVVNSNDNICPPNGTCEARLNSQTGDISGWAKILAYSDGWVKLKGTATDGSPYGVSVDNNPSSPNYQEFLGWAWSDRIGWLSFNCEDGGYNEGTGEHYSICGTSDYKVETSFSFNQPPDSPSNLSETLNLCAWGTSPQVAPGISIVLNWNYSDPDNDPQLAYEVWVDDNSSFPEPKFNHIVTSSAPSNSTVSYALDLSHDDEGDWLSALNWSTTYYWKIRVKDSGSQEWSSFSSTDSTTTPAHAYPNPDFDWSPISPSLEEIVQFCSTEEATGSISCLQDLSTCYDSSGPLSPPSCSGKTFSWTFLPLDTTEFATGTPTSSPTSENPRVRFTTTDDKYVSLQITDDIGSCSTLPKKIGVTPPLPKWKEVEP